MIKVNKIDCLAEAFDPEDNSLGFLNIYEWLDLRVQIKKEKAKGYYMMFKDKRIDFDIRGTCSDYPIGFYDDITSSLYSELI